MEVSWKCHGSVILPHSYTHKLNIANYLLPIANICKTSIHLMVCLINFVTIYIKFTKQSTIQTIHPYIKSTALDSDVILHIYMRHIFHLNKNKQSRNL